jgi:hypothetical protein
MMKNPSVPKQFISFSSNPMPYRFQKFLICSLFEENEFLWAIPSTLRKRIRIIFIAQLNTSAFSGIRDPGHFRWKLDFSFWVVQEHQTLIINNYFSQRSTFQTIFVKLTLKMILPLIELREEKSGENFYLSFS